jgi:hypothetical protein
MNRTHVVSLLVGFALILAVYVFTIHSQKAQHQAEAFADPVTAAAPTPTPTSTITLTTPITTSSDPVLVTMPLTENVLMYNQLFTLDSASGGVFWVSSIPTNGNMKFSIRASGGNVNITNGLQLMGTALEGPSSDSMTTNSDYSVPSFSVCFYGTISSLTSLPVTWYVMYAEARVNVSNIIQLRLTADAVNTNNVTLTAQIGVVSASWSIPKSTLVTGQNTLYTFTYDISNSVPVFTFFVGTSTPYTFTAVGAASPIVLGNTNIKVNETATLDMKLLAFVFYSTALGSSDQARLLTYFNQEASGLSRYILARNSAQDALAKFRSDFASNLDQCQNSLSTCQTKLKAAELSNVMRNPWLIHLDEANGASASLDDMYKCSPLAIKKFGASNALSAAAASASNIDAGKIAYPPSLPAQFLTGTAFNGMNIINPTKKIATPTTTTTTTATTGTTASPALVTSSSVASPSGTPTTPTGGDTAFWTGLFSFLQNQQTSNVSTTSNLTNLNDVYNKLATSALGSNTSNTATPAATSTTNTPRDSSSWFWI